MTAAVIVSSLFWATISQWVILMSCKRTSWHTVCVKVILCACSNAINMQPGSSNEFLWQVWSTAEFLVQMSMKEKNPWKIQQLKQDIRAFDMTITREFREKRNRYIKSKVHPIVSNLWHRCDKQPIKLKMTAELWLYFQLYLLNGSNCNSFWTSSSDYMNPSMKMKWNLSFYCLYFCLY